ncbi:hypothetical protein PC9H_002190 [Pleurotus ostreatus]|uniref:DUF6534 domain-containing protein n=1 Tax=Pleurotus ostreatus TaxID=5322 RepID=A0A8H7DL57_PLEOS|nr:uncharacterized protein PC9H_002190 [Pleurotus ostreatus]KAF7419599.1 hypothetical protein PC9H_002190 [Pleurotus ostreatus]
MSLTPPLAPSINIPLTIGALEIGLMFSGCLFGALTIQAIVYHSKFQQTDGYLTQLMVATIWFLELGQLCSHFHGIYYLTVVHHANLVSPPLSVGVAFLLSSCVGPLVETFYVSRLLVFSSRVVPALVGYVLTLARLAGWLYLSSSILSVPSFTSVVETYGLLLEILLSGSAAVDLIVAVANCWYLWKGRRRLTGNARGNTLRAVIDNIIGYTIKTGLITSISFMITLVCFLMARQYLIWMAVSSALTKVFSNCLLASLNSRPCAREGTDGSTLRDRYHNRRVDIYPEPNGTILSFVAGSLDGPSTINVADTYGSTHRRVSSPLNNGRHLSVASHGSLRTRTDGFTPVSGRSPLTSNNTSPVYQHSSGHGIINGLSVGLSNSSQGGLRRADSVQASRGDVYWAI